MDTRMLNIITLAYLGDSVYEVYVREHLIDTGIALVEDLQKEAIKFVSAKSQSKILNYLLENDILTDEEMEIVKRGRNYKRTTHPKNTDIITYKLSTGFEALIGDLYLRKRDRLDEIMRIIFDEKVKK